MQIEPAAKRKGAATPGRHSRQPSRLSATIEEPVTLPEIFKVLRGNSGTVTRVTTQGPGSQEALESQAVGRPESI